MRHSVPSLCHTSLVCHQLAPHVPLGHPGLGHPGRGLPQECTHYVSARQQRWMSAALFPVRRDHRQCHASAAQFPELPGATWGNPTRSLLSCPGAQVPSTSPRFQCACALALACRPGALVATRPRHMRRSLFEAHWGQRGATTPILAAVPPRPSHATSARRHSASTALHVQGQHVARG